MKIKLKSMVSFLLIYMMLIEIFISVFHFPRTVRFIIDIIALLLILFGRHKISLAISDKEFSWYFRYILLFMVFMVMNGVFRLVPIGQILWAVRNNYLYIFFGIIMIYLLKVQDVEKMFELFIKLQVVNVIMGTLEYFILHVQNDYLGGIFGIEQGCNANLNVYLMIINTYIICRYLYKKSSLKEIIWILGSSTYMAAISELKVFYVELVIIIICAVLLNRKSMKGFLILLGGLIGLLIGIRVMLAVNPESINNLLSFSNMVDYNTRMDYGGGDLRISRLGSTSQINRMFFKDNIFLKLFGMGLGACEDSTSFAICNSTFADHYRSLGYRNLTMSMNYLETGYIGIICFAVIFIWLFIIAGKMKNSMIQYKEMAVVCQIICIMTILNFWYSSAIRMNASYLTFFCIMSVFVYYRYEMKEKCRDD